MLDCSNANKPLKLQNSSLGHPKEAKACLFTIMRFNSKLQNQTNRYVCGNSRRRFIQVHVVFITTIVVRLIQCYSERGILYAGKKWGFWNATELLGFR